MTVDGFVNGEYIYHIDNELGKYKMEKKVKALLIKWGNNADDVEAMMDEWFGVIYNGNKGESARYIANMVRTAW